MTSLDHALYYARRGWRVVPIPPGYKHPHGINEWQRLATTDEARIRKYWGQNPTHGVGIATGPDSGLFAVDIDPDDGGDDSVRALELEHGPLPDTIQQLTGGGGTHHLFAWPEGHDIRNSASGVLGVGIDIRGAGGFIVAPPTIHPDTGRAYVWEIEHDPHDGVALAQAPEWMLELLTRPLVDTEPRRPPRKRIGADPLPGDWWEAQTSWPDELVRAGWSLHSRHHDAQGGEYELWTRPGKTPREGASASLYWRGSDVLKVFSTNAAPLEAERTYSLWGFHVEHSFGGDYEAAARTVRKSMPAATSTSPTTSDPASSHEAAPPAKPSIVHNGRQHDAVLRDAVAALHGANEPPSMFVRAGQLVRLREDEDRRPLIETLRTDHLRLELANAASWWRSLKDGGMTATPPPVDIAASTLAAGRWPMPALSGVVELPVLRPDGTFHLDHGYDPHTRLYHWHHGTPHPPIPAEPSTDELAAAVALVDELLCDFPWDTTADRANAWALLLTPLVRAVVGQVPMALIDAPEPGTGKGLLVKVCSIVTTGRAAALMSWPASDEELEKKITAMLMAGQTVAVFDNVEGMIKSSTLAAVLTADTWQGRVLGRSELIAVPNRATWAATGNNIDVGGDLARRCYRIRLDARQAQPWLRTGFRHPDLERWAAEHRHELLTALCTIVRSWWVAGRPLATELPAMGGYSSWVRTVGGILDHAGVTGFLANLADFHATADREAGAWEAFLQAMSDELGEQPVTVAELIVKMKDTYAGHRLRDPLPEDLAGDFERPQFSKRLGMALRRRVGRHYGSDGLHLVEMPRDRRRVAIFAVTARSVRLFEPGEGAGPDEMSAEVPRSSSQVAVEERGTAGPFPASSREKTEEQQPTEFQVTPGDIGPATPAVPRGDYLFDPSEPF